MSTSKQSGPYFDLYKTYPNAYSPLLTEHNRYGPEKAEKIIFILKYNFCPYCILYFTDKNYIKHFLLLIQETTMPRKRKYMNNIIFCGYVQNFLRYVGTTTKASSSLDRFNGFLLLPQRSLSFLQALLRAKSHYKNRLSFIIICPFQGQKSLQQEIFYYCHRLLFRAKCHYKQRLYFIILF